MERHFIQWFLENYKLTKNDKDIIPAYEIRQQYIKDTLSLIDYKLFYEWMSKLCELKEISGIINNYTSFYVGIIDRKIEEYNKEQQIIINEIEENNAKEKIKDLVIQLNYLIQDLNNELKKLK